MPLKKPWTVVGGATAALAIGAGGLLLGTGGDDAALRGPISLRDGVPIAAADNSDSSPDFEVVPAPVLSAEDSPNDSPGLPTANPADSPDDSPAQDSGPAAAPDDSPDDSPDQESAPTAAPADSPDDSPVQEPAPTTVPADSPDNSPDTGSVDSPDSSD